MSDSERDDLDALLTSPGWLRFKAWAESEYGPAILARAADEPNELEALSKLRQARAIKGAVDVMLTWPQRTIANHARQDAHRAVDAHSRRGGL